MKKVLLLTVTVCLVLLAGAQTVDEIVNKHIEAMGGLEKLASIKTIHSEGVAFAPNGSEITINTWIENKKLYRREINFGMGTRTTLLTDKGGWNTDRQGNMNPMKEEIFLRQEHQMDCEGPLVNYAAKGHKAELMGKETIDGKEQYKIKLSLKGGMEQTMFIDATTYYISRISYKAAAAGMGGGPGGNPDAELSINFSNYAKTEDGYVFAFTSTMGGGFGGSLNFEKIEVNKPIEEKYYLPK